MRIPLIVLGLVLLASCGAATPLQMQQPALTSQTASAPGQLQFYADHATLPSDAPFKWTWFTAPALPADIEQMRQLTPGDLISETANLANSAYFEDLVWETGYVLRDLRFYKDEVPCENCRQFDYVLVGQQQDGTYAGFRASVFWDH